MARQIFYDRLLADFAEYPRTILLSTHLIDEVANLLEHVLVINKGRIVVDSPADDLRGRAVTVSGLAHAVDEFAAHRRVLGRQGVGSIASVTVTGPLDDLTQARAREMNLQVEPVSLQEFVVRTAEQGTGDDLMERISA